MLFIYVLPECLTAMYTYINSIVITIINIVKFFMLLTFVDDVDRCFDNS